MGYAEAIKDNIPIEKCNGFNWYFPPCRICGDPLEIDGRPFHTKDKEKAQTLRDEVIADKLGEGWNVIRIDTENINTNVTKLVPAIKRILKYREEQKSAV